MLFSTFFKSCRAPSCLLARSFHSSLRSFNAASTATTHDLTPFKLVPKSNLYATLKIFNKPYLVTEGDRLTLPHNLKNVEVGATIQFNDIVNVGSKDLVYYPDEAHQELINIKGTIIEKTKDKAYTKIITKQRNRKSRRVLVKPQKTVIRISELSLKV